MVLGGRKYGHCMGSYYYDRFCIFLVIGGMVAGIIFIVKAATKDKAMDTLGKDFDRAMGSQPRQGYPAQGYPGQPYPQQGQPMQNYSQPYQQGQQNYGQPGQQNTSQSGQQDGVSGL